MERRPQLVLMLRGALDSYSIVACSGPAATFPLLSSAADVKQSRSPGCRTYRSLSPGLVGLD